MLSTGGERGEGEHAADAVSDLMLPISHVQLMGLSVND